MWDLNHGRVGWGAAGTPHIHKILTLRREGSISRWIQCLKSYILGTRVQSLTCGTFSIN